MSGNWKIQNLTSPICLQRMRPRRRLCLIIERIRRFWRIWSSSFRKATKISLRSSNLKKLSPQTSTRLRKSCTQNTLTPLVVKLLVRVSDRHKFKSFLWCLLSFWFCWCWYSAAVVVLHVYSWRGERERTISSATTTAKITSRLITFGKKRKRRRKRKKSPSQYSL